MVICSAKYARLILGQNVIGIFKEVPDGRIERKGDDVN